MKLTTPEIFAYGLKIAVVIAVAAFLGLHSINLFTFLFKDDQSIYAYLAFGLTGGGLVVYLADLKWAAKSELQKTVAISMIFICAVGELIAAGFGMRLAAYVNAGYDFTKEDVDNMILIVQLLAMAHALALIADFVGDLIIAAFQPALNYFSKPSVPAHPLLIPSPSSSNAPISEVGAENPSFPRKEKE